MNEITRILTQYVITNINWITSANIMHNKDDK